MRPAAVRSLILICLVASIVIPSGAGAQTPLMWLFFDAGGAWSDCPETFTPFDMYLVLQNAPYGVTAVEYRLYTPSDPYHSAVIVLDVSYPPQYSVSFGDPITGHSISFWPPLPGYEGDVLVCTMNCMMFTPCDETSMYDYPITVAEHPDSGYLRGTYSPDNDFFEIIGGTTYACMRTGPPWVHNAEPESETTVRAYFMKPVENWYDDGYPGGSYVLAETAPGDTIRVVDAVPLNDSMMAFLLVLDSPLLSGKYHTLYVTNACTNGTCMECAWDTRADFFYESPISSESSSWGRLKRLGAR